MAERLRVLFVTAWFPSSRSPSEGVFVREHAQAVQLYDDVVVLHVAGHDRSVKWLFQLEEERNVGLTPGLPTIRSVHRKLPVPGLSSMAYGAGAMAAVHFIEQRGFRPDIVHAHVYSAGWPAALIAGWRRIPMVLTEHNSAFPRRLLSPKQLRMAQRAFSSAALVMPVSRALQQGIEDYGIRASFQIVPNVVDTSIFHPVEVDAAARDTEASLEPGAALDIRRRLLFVGGLVPVKGVPDLLAALSTLNHHRRDWRRLAAGSRGRWTAARRVHSPGCPPRFERSGDISRLPAQVRRGGFHAPGQLSGVAQLVGERTVRDHRGYGQWTAGHRQPRRRNPRDGDR